ncbi:MAG: UDP-N-acetylglucosamine 1-carboxyvinyltransferase [Candidatus Omnitrophota bacterium]
MKKLVIEGAKRLEGSVAISGSKNACLPILAATLLTDEKCIIRNVPALRDIRTMIKLLENLGMDCDFAGSEIAVSPSRKRGYTAPYNLVSTMRASICVLGPLLARFKKAEVSFPGGCVIGPRPIDLHLKGMTSLGARITIEKGYVIGKTGGLRGNRIYLGGHFGSSVLATANVLMAAALAKGITVIENAACEPEITDLGEFLIKMGAKIRGCGTPRVEVEGVKRLGGAAHSVIPDRIEAGTFMIAAGITKGTVKIKGARPEHLSALIDKLTEAGVDIEESGDTITASRKGRLKPVDVTTLPYPGFPTDLQAQLMSLMTVTRGISVVTEKIFPRRFMHVSELNRMGAEIHIEGPSAIVKGVESLSGAPVMASDLRASAALVMAGLVAKGETEVTRIYHLDRGYDRMEKKLVKIGANIKRIKDVNRGGTINGSGD